MGIVDLKLKDLLQDFSNNLNGKSFSEKYYISVQKARSLDKIPPGARYNDYL